MNEKIFPASISESTDAVLSESLKAQARRHLPKWEKPSFRVLDYHALGWAERAHLRVAELNAQIDKQAEARRQFVEATQ